MIFDITVRPRPEERAPKSGLPDFGIHRCRNRQQPISMRASRRTATGEIVPASILRDAMLRRLLWMRSAGLNSIPSDMIGFTEPIHGPAQRPTGIPGPQILSRCDKIMCAAQIFLNSFVNRSGNRRACRESFMSYHNVAPSRLPTFLLPCPFCGHRMAVTSVTPTMFAAEVAAEGENTEFERHPRLHPMRHHADPHDPADCRRATPA